MPITKMTLKSIKLTILLVFGLSQHILSQGIIIDKVIAQVGDQVILLSNIQERKLQAIQQGMELENGIDCHILEEHMMQELLLNQAKIDSISIPESQVNAELENRIRFFEMQIGGREKLEEFYGKSVAEIKDEFYDMIEESMMVQEMERQITEDVRISPKEVREFFKMIPQDSIPYMNSQIEYARLVIKPKISESTKKDIIRKLESLRQDFVDGVKNFSTYASLESDDPGTRSRGGEFDFVTKGTFVPEFDAVAFSMEEGAISEVFETDYGYHILQLLERRGNEYRGRHILKIPKVDPQTLREVGNFADSVYRLVKMDELSFDEAAIRFSEDDETKYNGGKVFNPSTGDSKWDIAEIQRGLFITIDKMEPGDISKPILMPSETGAEVYQIIRLLNRSKPHVANLTDDYEFIKKAALAHKKQETIGEWVDESIGKAFIKITDDFQSCPFTYNWLNSWN